MSDNGKDFRSRAQPISGHKGRDRWMRALAAASDLSSRALRLTLWLSAAFNCKTGQCDPGHPALAKGLQVSTRTVSRAVDELEASGWIEVRRTVGNNTVHNQFNLLIPGDLARPSVDNMLSPEGAASVDNMLSTEEVVASVDRKRRFSRQKTGGSVDTQCVHTKEPDEPENLKRTAKPPSYSSDDDSQSTVNDATISDDEPPNQRAPGGALIEPLAGQQQPSRGISEKNIGRPGLNGVDAASPAISPFAQVLAIYPEDRVGDEARAYFVFARALDARGSLSAILEDLASLMADYGDDVPWLADILKTIERMPGSR